MSTATTRKRHASKRVPNFTVTGPQLPQYPPPPPTVPVQAMDPATKAVRYAVTDATGSLESVTQCRVFARLYADHREFVRRTVERHGVPMRDSEDVTQEVFATALSRIHDFDAAKAARPWLFVLAIHRAANYRRLARNRVEPITSAPPPEPVADDGDAESAVLASEERTLVREIIGRLSPKLRTMLIMHDLDERPMADIVAELKIPLKTAQARLKLAREEALRRGQSLALSITATPLRNRDLLRVREVLLDYVKLENTAPLERRAPAAPLTYFVFA